MRERTETAAENALLQAIEQCDGRIRRLETSIAGAESNMRDEAEYMVRQMDALAGCQKSLAQLHSALTYVRSQPSTP